MSERPLSRAKKPMEAVIRLLITKLDLTLRGCEGKLEDASLSIMIGSQEKHQLE